MQKTRIVFVGGWNRTKYTYRKLLRLAPNGYEIYFVPCNDLVYHNKPEDIAEAFRTILEKDNIGKSKIIAHSLGGIVALEYAYRYPDRVEELFLVNTAAIPPGLALSKKIIGTCIALTQYWSRKIVENLMSMSIIFSHPRKSIANLALAYKIDISNKLAKITTRTTLIWGEEDRIYPLSQAKMINDKMPNCELRSLSKMDHDWIIHSPKQIWDIINS